MTVYGLIQELKKYPDRTEVRAWDEEGISWPVRLQQLTEYLFVVPNEEPEGE